MPRKKQTEKHAKELARVRKFISRAEKRGYRFSDDLKGNLYGYSTQKLKALTPKRLYEQATGIDYETGEILTGTQKRNRERSASARLGAFTRKVKEGLKAAFQRKPKPGPETASPPPKPKAPPKPGGIKEKLSGLADKLKNFFKRGKKGPGPEPVPPTPPEEADVIISNLRDQLTPGGSMYATSRRGRTYSRGDNLAQATEDAKGVLRRMLDTAIARDGKNAVASRLKARAEDVARCLDQVRFSSDTAIIIQAMHELAEIINGGPLTLAEMQELGDLEEAEEDWEEPD